ncbi:hypothetical protein COT70_00645 [candidate division WWE3 bacterium CG09_land_8_20_14_0_10_47_33]|uniref:Peptidase S11 D-alanyl-D-alanine carboxypeptidase A N-terminal domain-containing protein n=1 Tax=candidate division WWE3 bacterium CG_4_9_14_0_2_um_filter_48_10 TaxID=1975078 RepID=A0A2M8EJM4_UNCKA|nr:MAG: hypothetical protein COT70_00645 [candidate division WWE3 bacterium CG09_land_8_20_14_0_10_47_33]PIZ40996.1 MAG: hypothetical protein COY35_01235 [candidate division WWE3 bacterium CG_4_10_14_0_2_um_filter_47_8]PJC22943.1 MAG: hypothetical protein CO059_01005 [candidate division WWE3 bacterium CG_4_9_14_0_2_um_filter_48_10]PJE52161.1 MAG: hypothetical protein COV28_00850 [candidate division WWE3 bacterium CG10_big_fil_rev_8_21_14_0_10_48_23]
MNFDPSYLLPKTKRLVETSIQIIVLKAKVLIQQSFGFGKELTWRDVLRFLVVVAMAGFLLSFGSSQLTPADQKVSLLHPILLADASLPPKITARSAYLLDLQSGFVLYDKNSLRKLPPASTVKVATALVALDNYKLDEVVVVPSTCVLRTGESIMGLQPREKITVRDLLRGLLIASASDAACTLAYHHPEGVLTFVAAMNHLAAALKLEQTYFVNPTGLDSSLQYSSAQDLTVLTKKALKDPFLCEVVKTKEITVSSNDGKFQHYLKTTNELLGKIPGILGVKTGYTGKAKEVFVFYFKGGEREFLGAVMGSSDRFSDTKDLLAWILSSFRFP